MINKSIIGITYENIKLKDLSLYEDLTEFSSNNVSDSLLYVPLIVSKNKLNGKNLVIDGNKRLNLLKNNKIEECLCGFIECENIRQYGLLRIKMNCNRHTTINEKFLFLNWLKSNCTSEEYRQMAVMLNINDKERHDFEQLSSALPIIIDAVLIGKIDISNISELNFYSDEDADIIIDLFSRFQFSRQTQRELLEWFPELAFRTKKSIKDIILEPEFSNICNDNKLNGPQKIKRLRDYCFEQRFPTLGTAKKSWNMIASSINPDPSCILFNPNEAFEKNTLEIRIKISDALKARKVMQQLAEISIEKWETLIYPALLYSGKK